MRIFEFGNRGSGTILIQPVDSHDLSVIGNEAETIRKLAGDDFYLVAVSVDSWNQDLAP